MKLLNYPNYYPTLTYHKCKHCGFEWMSQKRLLVWDKILFEKGCPNCKIKGRCNKDFIGENVTSKQQQESWWRKKLESLREF